MVLSRLQAVFNNSASTATGKTPNAIAYGFTPNRALDLLGTESRYRQRNGQTNFGKSSKVLVESMNRLAESNGFIEKLHFHIRLP